MGRTTFRLIGKEDRGVSVEKVKPSGQRRLIPDVRDEAEAQAWIIQMQRLIQAAHPHLPGQKSRSG
jgi:hypothetical protein